MSSLDYLDLCRLCLVKDRVSVPIFEGEGDVRQIFLKIAACLPVKVGREDKLPKKICDDCVYKVELFYQFWNTTANAEKQLLQWLGDVSLDDKQGYVTGTHPSLMKPGQNPGENRLDGSVMQQVNDHPNNMGMGMLDSMGMGMPMMINTSGQQQQPQQQMTSVPMDSGGVQTVQAVPGPSTQSSHDQRKTSTNQEDDEDESEEDDNSDDECDGDDGMAVKEESEEDPTSSRTIEPTTFVNVSLACDEAGPSGLQQQKIGEMPEMVMPPTDGDPKSGHVKRVEVESAEVRGMFTFEQESFVMRKWQILEFDGKPYYAFVPEDDEPLDAEEIPNLDKPEEVEFGEESPQDEFIFEGLDMNENGESFDNYDTDETNEFSVDEEEAEEGDTKPAVSHVTNGDTNTLGDLYQVKVEGSMVTLEKLAGTVLNTAEIPESQGLIKEEPPMEIPEEQNEELAETEAEEMLYEDRTEDDEEEVEEEAEESSEQTKSTGLSAHALRQHDLTFAIMKNPSGPMKCRVCSEVFSSSMAFRKHVAWTHKKKVCIQENGAYICAVCDFRTLKKSLFADHLERKHETWTRKRATNILFPCEACGFVCRSKHSLQSHFIRKHTDSWEHNCQFCEKKFKVKGDLTNHVRFHHKEKPINCDVCGKLCQNTGSLYVHQKWAHYKPKYECHICRRRMVTQENLDQHLITQHEQREKIVCAQCGKTFTKKDSFKRHMAVHTGSKPHSCPICTKPFARQSQLRQHVLIHTGQRPFVCDICGKGFTQKPGLICHRKTHPGPLPPLPVMPIAELVRDFIAQNEEGQSQDIMDLE